MEFGFQLLVGLLFAVFIGLNNGNAKLLSESNIQERISLPEVEIGIPELDDSELDVIVDSSEESQRMRRAAYQYEYYDYTTGLTTAVTTPAVTTTVTVTTPVVTTIPTILTDSIPTTTLPTVPTETVPTEPVVTQPDYVSPTAPVYYEQPAETTTVPVAAAKPSVVKTKVKVTKVKKALCQQPTGSNRVKVKTKVVRASPVGSPATSVVINSRRRREVKTVVRTAAEAPPASSKLVRKAGEAKLARKTKTPTKLPPCQPQRTKVKKKVIVSG